MKCDTVQGYLFAAPMPAEKLVPAVRARSGTSFHSLLERSPGDQPWLAQTA